MIKLTFSGFEELGIKIKEDMDDVLRMSTQDLAEEAQKIGPSKRNPGGGQGGRMPVDTGFLRNSIAVHFDGEPMPPIIYNPGSYKAKLQRAGALAGNIDNAYAKIAVAESGDIIYITWNANYAPIVEYGFNGPARLFATSAAEKWDTIVKSNAAALNE